MPPKPLTRNRIVEYIMPDGQRRPAIVTRVDDDGQSASLNVFTDGANEGGVAAHQRNIRQGEEPGCWNWPQIDAPAAEIAKPLAMAEAA